MNRIKAVQQVLEGREVRLPRSASEYGKAFRRITADEKIAVDPAFKLSARSRRLADANARATQYFETSSDALFANETAFLEQHGIDVALFDAVVPQVAQGVLDVANDLPIGSAPRFGGRAGCCAGGRSPSRRRRSTQGTAIVASGS